MPQIFELLMLLFIFVGVLGLTYIVTKKIAHIKQGPSGQKNMNIVEVLPLNQGQYLYIIKIGEKYCVFSGTKEKLTFCFELEEEKIQLKEMTSLSFESYLQKFKQNIKQDKGS